MDSFHNASDVVIGAVDSVQDESVFIANLASDIVDDKNNTNKSPLQLFTGLNSTQLWIIVFVVFIFGIITYVAIAYNRYLQHKMNMDNKYDLSERMSFAIRESQKLPYGHITDRETATNHNMPVAWGNDSSITPSTTYTRSKDSYESKYNIENSDDTDDDTDDDDFSKEITEFLQTIK